jgi:transposase
MTRVSLASRAAAMERGLAGLLDHHDLAGRKTIGYLCADICGIPSVVAMEATGVYWIPLYELLEAKGFEVHLVNSRATRQVSGRKSDVLDCQWIQQLMSYGLLRGAFRPPQEICALRAVVRQRQGKVQEQSRAAGPHGASVAAQTDPNDTPLQGVFWCAAAAHWVGPGNRRGGWSGGARVEESPGAL